jgi:uncharacterized protein YgiM (DUF1202 family)
MQTDDMKVQVKAESDLKKDLDMLQKKYDMTRRLCNLRNEDIVGLNAEVAKLKDQIVKMQAAYQEKMAQLYNKYVTSKELVKRRTKKLSDLRKQFGIPDELAEDE